MIFSYPCFSYSNSLGWFVSLFSKIRKMPAAHHLPHFSNHVNSLCSDAYKLRVACLVYLTKRTPKHESASISFHRTKQTQTILPARWHDVLWFFNILSCDLSLQAHCYSFVENLLVAMMLTILFCRLLLLILFLFHTMHYTIKYNACIHTHDQKFLLFRCENLFIRCRWLMLFFVVACWVYVWYVWEQTLKICANKNMYIACISIGRILILSLLFRMSLLFGTIELFARKRILYNVVNCTYFSIWKIM